MMRSMNVTYETKHMRNDVIVKDYVGIMIVRIRA
jgi:hypothetical protein